MNSTQANTSSDEITPLPIITIQICMVIAGILSIISILANSYILYVIFINKDLRSASFYGLANLSIANLVVAFTFPITPLFVLITYNSPLQHSEAIKLVLCCFILPSSVVALQAANGSLAFIAIEKYYTIVRHAYPRRQLHRRKVLTILIGLWIIGILQHWPRSIIVLDRSSIPNICTLFTQDDLMRNIMLVAATIIHIYPFIIMLICHVKIAKTLKQRHRFFISAAILRQLKFRSFNQGGRQTQRLNNAIKMLRRVAQIQFICCTTGVISMLTFVIGYATKLNSYVVGFAYAISYIALVATGLHGPILYILCLRKFRQPLESHLLSIQCWPKWIRFKKIDSALI
ncbi:Neuropeptide FF receptor 1 [Trichoplax sp. H2]|nr:Neuropeptide FF receptor 1 [Trichoplax sp. H2]|eukprot:RDD39973.1 Neuropeptide FF receptor 1 [Trichoplax sp. H2]